MVRGATCHTFRWFDSLFGDDIDYPEETVNGLVTVGARNVFDEDPPTSVNITSPYYSNYLHDVYGRVPYVRYEQDL